jgi:hypothetical protein
MSTQPLMLEPGMLLAEERGSQKKGERQGLRGDKEKAWMAKAATWSIVP